MYLVEIKKPLYENEEGCVVNVRDKYVLGAIKSREPIKISSWWRGQPTSKIFNPRDIKASCKIVKQVFLRPDEPMKMYQIFIPRPKSYDEEIEEMAKSGVFG